MSTRFKTKDSTEIDTFTKRGGDDPQRAGGAGLAEEIVICAGARTAWAEYASTPGFGLFKDVSAVDLAARAAEAALLKAKVNPDQVDHVVFGNAMQTGIDGMYGARHVGLKAKVPFDRPALTVNRLCGSGIEAIAVAARLIRLGEARIVLAGGMENMSQAPYVLRGLRGNPPRFGADLKLEDSLFNALQDPYCNLFMAQIAERCAKKYGIGREAQDELALRSHRLGAESVKAGRFHDEIVPVKVKKGREEVAVASDDHIKLDTSIEKLAALSPAFGKDGTVTAGNASGIVDGAAAVVVTTRGRAYDLQLPLLGRIVGWSVVGVEPDFMGMGPAPAIRALLKREEMRIEDVDLYEINEAFAAQYCAVEKELELPRERVNVNGGAIALGHPLGATGTRLVLTILLELRRRGKRYGVASACIGGGQGIAMLVESSAA